MAVRLEALGAEMNPLASKIAMISPERICIWAGKSYGVVPEPLLSVTNVVELQFLWIVI